MRKPTGSLDNLASCEMIQEIYGIGPYRLLHETDDELSAHLMIKYRAEDMELFIRQTLSHRRTEATGARPQPK